MLRVLRELAEALEAVHSAALVHGDVKASNVMLDRQGRVILMDLVRA
ncbi:protein kinase [Dokdonella sp.]|nr:protein kinase [Dokdonella sp.]